MLFDSHAHIDDERFNEDREAVIERAFEGGLDGILNVGACMASSARAVELAEKHPRVYAAVGIHPHDAKGAKEEDYRQLADWSSLDKVVAIGEIGLDYYYDFSDRPTQKKVFIRQLELAREVDLPIIIHDRDAHGDTMAILKKEGKGLTGSIHCFSGSYEMAKELLKMGWFLGVDGPLTFKNSAKLPEIVAKIPLERLLLETDCPYLAPVPKRGRRNEPAYVKYIAEKVAEIRNISLEEVANQTTKNAIEVFNL